jgi:predicted TIM-barrel fold metal-dependent hydrolase
MDEIGLIPLIHCHHDVDFEEIWRLRSLAESFPNLRILCLDSMTHREQFEGALAAGELTPNISFDVTSSVMGPEAISRFVDRLGPTRLLFGTNLYSLQRPAQCRELESVLAARIPEDAKHLILGGNARVLFGLNRP